MPDLEVKASFPIDRVTVYPQSALIERRGRLALEAGETALKLSGLPADLTPDTVRIAVDPGAGLRVIDLSAGERFVDLSGGREYEKLKAKYEELLTEKRLAQARLANCLSELELFLSKGSLADRYAADKYLTVNLESWKEFFGFLRDRLDGNRALYRENLFALLELEKKISAAGANLAQRTGAPASEHEIAVRVEAPRAAEYSLSVSYLQGSVFWYPVYAVAGEPGDKRVTVSLSAVVGQATGEDWLGVDLLLSTAVPLFSCSIPELASRRLREQDAKIELRKAAPARAAFAMKSVDKLRSEALGKDAAGPLGEMTSDEASMSAPAAKEAPQERVKMAFRGGKGKMKRDSRQADKKIMPAAPPATASAVAFGAAPHDRRQASEQEVGDVSDTDKMNEIVGRFESKLEADENIQRSVPFADELFRAAGAGAFEPPVEVADEPGALSHWMSQGVSPLESLGGYDYRFPVAGRRDVPSSPAPKKVPVARKELPAEFVYVTVPAEKEAVYLKAHFANDSENPLPAGPAQVFAGDHLIGSLLIPTLGLGEKGELSLGAERDIKVLRRERGERRRRGVVAKEVITDFTVDIELVSFKEAAVIVEVYDRLPASRQPREITVSDFRAEPAVKPTERNILVWRVTLDPGAKRVITHTYSIRHPENFRVTLEEDPVPFQRGKEK